MPPSTLVPGQPVAPAPVATTPQGVAQPVPAAAPVPTALPKAPAVAATPAPVATPNFDTQGIMNNIASYYKIPGDTANIVAAGQTKGNIAGQQFEKQKAENEIDIQNKQNQLDPSKYTVTKDPKTGGIDITNSMGDKVDLATYVNLTGANPAETLQKAGVTDQADQKFITAYNNMQTYAQAQIAAQNGDEQAKITVGEFQKANPGLANLELGQLSSAFMAQYGSYFGAPQQQGANGGLGGLTGVNNTLTSQNSPIASSPYYELQQYPSLNTPNPVTQQLLSGNNSQSNSGIASILQQQLNGQ